MCVCVHNLYIAHTYTQKVKSVHLMIMSKSEFGYCFGHFFVAMINTST